VTNLIGYETSARLLVVAGNTSMALPWG